jgi:F-type H+-transporting ATPase subunit b
MKFDRKTRAVLLYVALPIYVALLGVFIYVSNVYKGKYPLPASEASAEYEQFLAEDYILDEDTTIELDGSSVIKEAGTIVDEPILFALMKMRDDKKRGEFVKLRGKGPVIGFQYTFVFILLNFVIMVLFLYGLLWKPVLAVLDKRKATVAEDLAAARDQREKATVLHDKYQSTMAGARDEREEIIADGRREGSDERKRIVEEARNEAEAILERARQTIEGEKRRLEAELTGRIAGYSRELAERILSREINPEDHSGLVEEFLAEIGSKGEGEG